MPAPQRIDDPLREAPQRIEEFWRRDPYGFARVEAFAISRWVGRVTDDDLSDVYVGVAEIVDLGLSANEATKKIRSVLSSAVARRRRHEQRSVLGEIGDRGRINDESFETRELVAARARLRSLLGALSAAEAAVVERLLSGECESRSFQSGDRQAYCRALKRLRSIAAESDAEAALRFHAARGSEVRGRPVRRPPTNSPLPRIPAGQEPVPESSLRGHCGSRTGYSKWRCRCDPCRDAESVFRAAYRAARRAA